MSGNGSDEITDVFRTEWPRLVATLVRDVGDLDLAEECAQDAFVEATARWGAQGRPDRPGAWLLTTARRRAIDRVRRSRRFEAVVAELEVRASTERSPHQLIDDQLALLLGCCHPALGPDAQIALTLRAVGGLSTAQIAQAFFVSDDTMTRRLSRAKTKIRGARIPFRVGDADQLRDRLGSVCGVVYSIFTEGHTSSGATSLVRGDLCEEAMWLGVLLTELVPEEPEVHGLLALMLLTDARRAARLDGDGRQILLADQDRSLWDQEKVTRGLASLSIAYGWGAAGTYQLQAAIAALHATSPSIDDTDWRRIVALYDALLVRRPNAVVALNRAVAVSYADSPTAALAAIDAITEADDLAEDLTSYPYFHSARAELLARLGRHSEAAAAFDVALRHSRNGAERRHLRNRLQGVRQD